MAARAAWSPIRNAGLPRFAQKEAEVGVLSCQGNRPRVAAHARPAVTVLIAGFQARVTLDELAQGCANEIDDMSR